MKSKIKAYLICAFVLCLLMIVVLYAPKNSVSRADDNQEEYTLPCQPANLAAGWTLDQSGQSMMVVHWDISCGQIEIEGRPYANYGYEVYRDDNPEPVFIIGPSEGDNFQSDSLTYNLTSDQIHLDRDIEPNHSYKYTIVAFDTEMQKSKPASVTGKYYPKEETQKCDVCVDDEIRKESNE